MPCLLYASQTTFLFYVLWTRTAVGILSTMWKQRERMDAGAIFINIYILLNTVHQNGKEPWSLNLNYIYEAIVIITGI